MMSRLLACGLLLTLGGCDLFKKNDDALPPPPVSAVAVTPTSIAPEIPASPNAATAVPVAPSVQNPVVAVPAGEHAKGSTSGGTAVTHKGGAASGAPAASAAPVDPDGPATPSTPSLALPTISAQCKSGCQKSYQDCTTQSGAANPLEMVQKCGTALSSCFSACK